MTTDELIAVNSYPCYGGGGLFSGGWPPMTIKGFDVVKGGGQRVYTVDKMYPFKLHRFFVDNFIFTDKNSFNTEPTTSGNFYYDSYFKLCKAHGVKTWWVPAGVFSWYAMPINPSTGKAYSRRKSMPVPHYQDGRQVDLFSKEAWDDIALHCKRIAEHYNGTGLLDYLELVGNEVYDFPWNTQVTGTPEIVAEGVYWCYKAVREVNQEIGLIMPSGTTWNLARLEELCFYTKRKFESMGEQMPTDIEAQAHMYLRDGSQSQGGGTTGITPEDAQLHIWLKGMDALCDKYGMPGYKVGEYGYGVDDDKQHAPDLEGLNRHQSQGICNIRIPLILGTSKYFTGAAIYHCRHLFDQGAYDYTGMCDKEWNWTQAMTEIIIPFKEKYGTWSPVLYSFANEISTVKIQKGEEIKWLQWTNKNNIGTLTPNFKEVTEPTQPPTMNLTVINKQLQWQDGVWCDLIHADSPESRLHPSYQVQFSNECKVLPTKGINCITVTLRGDDVTAISPWVNNTPSQGVDVAKLTLWATQLKEFLTECEKNGLRGVIIAYVGERTNFKSITDQQYENWFVEMGKAFAEISGSIIFGWEEIWDGSDLNTMRFCDRIGSLLKSYLPTSLLMYHNNPGQKAFNAGSSFVKLVCIQEKSVSEMKATAQAALAKGFAVHFHELYPGFKTTNTQDANRTLMKQLCDAAMSIGVKNVGCFASDYDLQAPDPNKLGYLYEYQAQLLSGNTPPNPTPMRKAFITSSTSASSTTGITLTEGKNMPVGKYAIFVDGANGVDLELFKDNVSFIAKRREGSPPLAVGGDDNGVLRLKDFPVGNYKLTISGQADINFTVGTVTPNPDVKGTTFVKKNGKIEFSFEDNTKLIVTPD